MTARQLADWLEWMQHYQPYPDRLDPYFAMLCAITNNAWSEDAKSPQEFLIYKDPYEVEITAEEMRARLGLKG